MPTRILGQIFSGVRTRSTPSPAPTRSVRQVGEEGEGVRVQAAGMVGARAADPGEIYTMSKER